MDKNDSKPRNKLMLPHQEKHIDDVHTHHVDQYHNHLRLFKKHNSLKNMSSKSSDFHAIMALHHLQQASSHKKAFTRLGNIMHREFMDKNDSKN